MKDSEDLGLPYVQLSETMTHMIQIEMITHHSNDAYNY
jgi:hypothetical protein